MCPGHAGADWSASKKKKKKASDSWFYVFFFLSSLLVLRWGVWGWGGVSHFVAQAGQGIPDNHLASVSLVLGYQV